LQRSILPNYGNEKEDLAKPTTTWQKYDFPLLHSVQTGSEAHQASYPMGNRGDFSRSEVARE
jgi:hypothetical protein